MTSLMRIALVVPLTVVITVAATIAGHRVLEARASGADGGESPALISKVHAALDEFMPVGDLSIVAEAPPAKSPVALDMIGGALDEPGSIEVERMTLDEPIEVPPFSPDELAAPPTSGGVLTEAVAALPSTGGPRVAPDAEEQPEPEPEPEPEPQPAPAPEQEPVEAIPAPASRTGIDYGRLTNDLRRAADTLDRFNRKLMQVIDHGHRAAPPPASSSNDAKTKTKGAVE